jgi:DNA-binding Lrp family transcriptional regulator
MSRGRKPSKELSVRDKKIVERYNSTSDTMPLLAKKYGISKQRIYEILKRAKRLGYVIKRQKLLARYHDFHQCEVCNKILKIAKKDDLITRRHLAQMLSIEVGVCNRHLGRLKGSGFISKMFATIRSDRLVKSLQCYRNDSFSPAAVGRKFGYKNFYSILSYQKKKGISVERMLKSPFVSNQKQEEQNAIFPSISQNKF